MIFLHIASLLFHTHHFLISMIIQGIPANQYPGTATLSRRKPASAGKFCGSCGAQGHAEGDIYTIRLNVTNGDRMSLFERLAFILRIRKIAGSNLNP